MHLEPFLRPPMWVRHHFTTSAWARTKLARRQLHIKLRLRSQQPACTSRSRRRRGEVPVSQRHQSRRHRHCASPDRQAGWWTRGLRKAAGGAQHRCRVRCSDPGLCVARCAVHLASCSHVYVGASLAAKYTTKFESCQLCSQMSSIRHAQTHMLPTAANAASGCAGAGSRAGRAQPRLLGAGGRAARRRRHRRLPPQAAPPTAAVAGGPW